MKGEVEMKYESKCFEEFTNCLEDYFDITLVKDKDYSVNKYTDEVILSTTVDEKVHNLFEFYYDAWMSALDYQIL